MQKEQKKLLKNQLEDMEDLILLFMHLENQSEDHLEDK